MFICQLLLLVESWCLLRKRNTCVVQRLTFALLCMCRTIRMSTLSSPQMHPARFCRNPLMLPQTLDEQRRDGELYESGANNVSPEAGKRRHLYQVAQVRHKHLLLLLSTRRESEYFVTTAVHRIRHGSGRESLAPTGVKVSSHLLSQNCPTSGYNHTFSKGV